jgi:hypothetical protein
VSTAVAAEVDDGLWSAIGDPTRRRMLDLLLSDGGGTATTAGREQRYRVDDAQLARAVAQLASVGSAWDARLQRIKRIAEAIQRAQPDRPQN